VSGTLQTDFVVTDRFHDMRVEYTGILPDLFREGQSVITTGHMRGGEFAASEVLAKHDETYMPREVADAIAKAKAAGRTHDPWTRPTRTDPGSAVVCTPVRAADLRCVAQCQAADGDRTFAGRRPIRIRGTCVRHTHLRLHGAGFLGRLRRAEQQSRIAVVVSVLGGVGRT